MKLYGKICHEEGVVWEKKFKTEAEAMDWLDIAKETLEAIDCEDHFAAVDDKPAVDEDGAVESTHI